MSEKFQGEVIKLPKVRLSFPDLYEAVKFDKNDPNSKPRYGATFLLDPKNPEHAAAIKHIKSETERAIKTAWGERPAKLKLEFFGKGEDRTNSQTGKIHQGYEGMMWVSGNAQEDKQPLLLDKDRAQLAKGDPRLYGGVYVNATINLYVGPKQFGARVCCAVRGVQTLNYGDAFGSFVSDKEFADFDADDDQPEEGGYPFRDSGL